MNRFNPFTEDYAHSNLKRYYIIKDNPDSDKKSIWEYTNEKIHPHKNAIKQSAVLSCADDIEKPSLSCTSTMLEVRFKIFYDVEIAFSFRARKIGGWVGVIFRKLDDFNYYALEINQEWIRVKKMWNGKPSIIKFVKLEDNIKADIWHFVKLKAVKNVFTVTVTKEDASGEIKPEKQLISLKAEDLYIKSGGVAWTTDNTSEVYFDKLSFNPLECFKDSFNPEDPKKFQLKTNRFRDNYKSDINLNWMQDEHAENPTVYKMSVKGKK